MTEARARQQQYVEHEHPHDAHVMNSLGMWIFLAGEVLFFGAMFTAYAVYRYSYPDIFAEASRHLDLVAGALNTGILLLSSFTMALAVHAAQVGRRRALIFFLLLTMLLGTVFLGIKGLEYVHKFDENLFPGANFIYPGEGAREARLFFSLYYTMTGIHAVHMLAGIFVLSVITFLAWRKRFSPENYDGVELTGLYWHFVDIVWIFLFPLLYLIDRT